MCVYGLASSFFFRESFSTQGKDGCQLLQKYFLPSCQAATLPKSHCCGCSVIKSCLTLCDPGTAALQAFLYLAISWSFIKVMSTELVMPSNHLIPCHPLLLLPSVFPSIRVYSNELALRVRWPKYCNYSLGPSSEYTGLISSRIYWFDLLVVQETLKSLLQHHSSKASIPLCSAFFVVQLSRPYMTTGKTRSLTIKTFVDKVMSLLFNMLSRFVIAFLSESKGL